MILQDIVLLASNTARTKAYLQSMIKENKIPSFCIVYTNDYGSMIEEEEQYRKSEDKADKCDIKYFDINIPLLYSLKEAQVKYSVIENKDINSLEMSECISKISQQYIIYSGYGGYILKEHLFKLGKKFIHVHAGILPRYRGSTTVYYSLLQENLIGATAIFLNEGIDTGEIITQNTFSIPNEKVDIDYIYEPYTRACVLMEAINIYIKDGIIESKSQDCEDEETYFIIHPVLKHIAILKADKCLEENTK